MGAVYFVKDKEYEVELCTAEDVVGHYAVVKDGVTDVPEDMYVRRMLEAVKQGTGWKVVTGGEVVAFIYVYKVINAWMAASVYTTDHVGMMLAFKELADKLGEITIRYTPHEGMMGSMRSLVSGRSIRKYRNGEGYVRIRLAEIAPKFKKMYELLGVEYAGSN